MSVVALTDPSLLSFYLETDIERLKRRIESLVKSNDEKVRRHLFCNPHFYLFHLGTKNRRFTNSIE